MHRLSKFLWIAAGCLLILAIAVAKYREKDASTESIPSVELTNNDSLPTPPISPTPKPSILPPPSSIPTDPPKTPVPTSSLLNAPISRWQERVTKKPFGLEVSKENSPISPERFSGIHAGTDFEILPGEEDSDVNIRAICTGPLKAKRNVSGYGGVAIQSCTLEDQPITVIYGHLKLASIIAPVNTTFKSGDTIGILGKGYSPETDNERKHLHLGIHKGSAIVYAGYVQTRTSLNDWLDITAYLH